MDARYYALEKIAMASPGVWSRVGGALKRLKPTWSGTKKFMIGEPKRLSQEINRGQAWDKGSLLHSGITEGFKDPLSFGLYYGLPGYDAYTIAKDPHVKDKGSRIGGLIGGSVLGLSAYRPLGLLGSMGAGILGETVGSGIGSAISRTKSPPTPAHPPLKSRVPNSGRAGLLANRL